MDYCYEEDEKIDSKLNAIGSLWRIEYKSFTIYISKEKYKFGNKFCYLCVSLSLFVKKKGKKTGTFTCNLTNYSICTFSEEQSIELERTCESFLLFTLCHGVFIATIRESVGRKRAHPATPTSLPDSGYRIPRFVRKLNGYIIFWKGHSTLLPWRTRATGVEKRRGTCLLRC